MTRNSLFIPSKGLSEGIFRECVNPGTKPMGNSQELVPQRLYFRALQGVQMTICMLPAQYPYIFYPKNRISDHQQRDDLNEPSGL